MEIPESNMIFGPFSENVVFPIEKSKLYNDVGSGISTVEFILVRYENQLYFVEAKSSSPQPTKENNIRFDEFINEITDKFIHSFNLYYSSILGRREHYEEISDKFTSLDNSKVKIKFILVINGHKEEWLPPLTEALNRNMSYHGRIWNSDIIVLNDELAKRYNLVKSIIV